MRINTDMIGAHNIIDLSSWPAINAFFGSNGPFQNGSYVEMRWHMVRRAMECGESLIMWRGRFNVDAFDVISSDGIFEKKLGVLLNENLLATSLSESTPPPQDQTWNPAPKQNERPPRRCMNSGSCDGRDADAAES